MCNLMYWWQFLTNVSSLCCCGERKSLDSVVPWPHLLWVHQAQVCPMSLMVLPHAHKKTQQAKTHYPSYIIHCKHCGPVWFMVETKSCSNVWMYCTTIWLNGSTSQMLNKCQIRQFWSLREAHFFPHFQFLCQAGPPVCPLNWYQPSLKLPVRQQGLVTVM